MAEWREVATSALMQAYQEANAGIPTKERIDGFLNDLLVNEIECIRDDTVVYAETSLDEESRESFLELAKETLEGE